MRQIVIGVFDSYAEAYSAQVALGGAGVPQTDIAVYSTSADAPVEKGPRVYAPGGGEVRHHKAMFDRLEQLFARLFKPGEYPLQTDDYRQFIRRGGTIVSADVSEPQVDMTLDLMRRAGAADIEERANEWRNRPVDAKTPGQQDDATSRDGSPKSETSTNEHDEKRVHGEQGGNPAPSLHRAQEAAAVRTPPAASNAHTTSPGHASAAADAGLHGGASASTDPNAVDKAQHVKGRTQQHGSIPWGQPASREPSAQDVGAAHAPQDENLKSRAAHSFAGNTGAAKAEPPPGTGYAGDPNLGMPQDEAHEREMRRIYDAHFASTGASYDEYRRAYTHGATLGQEERYRGSDWSKAEPGVRETWESSYPESRWDRIKAAVRHGWDRVRWG